MFGGKMMILKFLHCQCLGVNLQHQKVMKKCQQVIKKRQKVIKNARIAHQIIGMQLIQEGHFPNHHLLLKKENFDQVCILIFRLISKEGCNRGHGLSAAIKLGTPEPKFLQSGD